MKIKFTSLLLLVVLLFSALSLTACGDDEQETTETVTAPMTITLYSIKNDSTTDEAIALVEKELNRISRAQYNTSVKLVLYTEAEYDAKLAEKRAAAKANPPAQQKPSTSKNPTYETTEVDGFVEYIYPDVTASQLDVFLVRDQNTYMELVNNKEVANLQSLLSYDFSTMASYINSYLMDATKVNGSSYAVPNNHLLGSYVYLLVNKNLADSLGYTDRISTFKTLADLKDYLGAVKTSYPSAKPLINCPEASAAQIVDGTMIGTMISDSKYLEDNMPVSLLTQTDYVAYLAAKQAYEQTGYLTYDPNFDGTTECGAAFVSAMPGAAEELYGDDYYTILYSTPMVTNTELFSSMYVVSAYSVNTKRSMEVISLLTTNEEFRNIFQYGVEDVHYTRDEATDLIHPENDQYSMNSLYTGNGYLLEPNDTMTATELDLLAPRTYEEVKAILGDACKDQKWIGDRTQALLKSINNAVNTSPYHGFTINYKRGTEGAIQANIDDAIAFNEKELTKIQAITYESFLSSNPGATLADYVDHLNTKYLNLGAVSSQRFIAITGIGDSNSPASQFRNWYIKKFPEYIYKPAA